MHELLLDDTPQTNFILQNNIRRLNGTLRFPRGTLPTNDIIRTNDIPIHSSDDIPPEFATPVANLDTLLHRAHFNSTLMLNFTVLDKNLADYQNRTFNA